VAAVYRPGRALTGVSTYAETLKTALAGHIELEFMKQPPGDGFDLIHFIDIKSAKPADFAGKSVPVIADLHDYYWSEVKAIPGPDAPVRMFLQSGRRPRYQQIIQAASAVIVHSKAVAKHVQGKKVFNVPIAIDFEKFRGPLDQDREQMVLLVGRDAWRKGLGTLINALRMLTPEFPSVRVEVAGKDYLHNRIWASIMALGLDVKFIGELDQDRLARKYREAMVIYLGSWQEGFGLSLAEGMAAGCVAVGSTAGGIPEVAEDGLSGILFTAGDEIELSAKLRAMFETPELRKRFSAAGQRRVKEMLSFDKMREALLKAYEEVLKVGG